MERYLHKMENIKASMVWGFLGFDFEGVGGTEVQAKIYGDSCTFLTGSLPCASIKEIAGKCHRMKWAGLKIGGNVVKSNWDIGRPTWDS